MCDFGILTRLPQENCVFFEIVLDFVPKRVHNVLVRIIGRLILKDFWAKNTRARSPLNKWYETVNEARWSCFADVRRTFNFADTYHKEDRAYIIFNVGGNKFRVIAAVNYAAQAVVIVMVLTHTEYSRNKLKNRL